MAFFLKIFNVPTYSKNTVDLWKQRKEEQDRQDLENQQRALEADKIARDKELLNEMTHLEAMKQNLRACVENKLKTSNKSTESCYYDHTSWYHGTIKLQYSDALKVVKQELANAGFSTNVTIYSEYMKHAPDKSIVFELKAQDPPKFID